VLVWLSVWSKVQMICLQFSWCHCHPSPLPLLKSSNGCLPRLPAGKEAIKWVYCSVVQEFSKASYYVIEMYVPYFYQIHFGHWLQNAIRMHHSVQSPYNNVYVQFQPLITTPLSEPGRWVTRSWTGMVQSQDKASLRDVLLVGHRPSGLQTISPTLPHITLSTGLHTCLPNILWSNLFPVGESFSHCTSLFLYWIRACVWCDDVGMGLPSVEGNHGCLQPIVHATLTLAVYNPVIHPESASKRWLLCLVQLWFHIEAPNRLSYSLTHFIAGWHQSTNHHVRFYVLHF